MCIFSYVNKVEYLGGVKRKRANPRGVALGRHDNTADIRNQQATNEIVRRIRDRNIPLNRPNNNNENGSRPRQPARNNNTNIATPIPVSRIQTSIPLDRINRNTATNRNTTTNNSMAPAPRKPVITTQQRMNYPVYSNDDDEKVVPPVYELLDQYGLQNIPLSHLRNHFEYGSPDKILYFIKLVQMKEYVDSKIPTANFSKKIQWKDRLQNIEKRIQVLNVGVHERTNTQYSVTLRTLKDHQLLRDEIRREKKKLADDQKQALGRTKLSYEEKIRIRNHIKALEEQIDMGERNMTQPTGNLPVNSNNINVYDNFANAGPNVQQSSEFVRIKPGDIGMAVERQQNYLPVAKPVNDDGQVAENQTIPMYSVYVRERAQDVTKNNGDKGGNEAGSNDAEI